MEEVCRSVGMMVSRIMCQGLFQATLPYKPGSQKTIIDDPLTTVRSEGQ